MTEEFSIIGIMSNEGNKYIWLYYKGKSAFIPLFTFQLGGNDLLDELWEWDICIKSRRTLNKIIKAAKNIKDYSRSIVANNNGWSESVFVAMNSGTVHPKNRYHSSTVASDRFAKRPTGTHEAWLTAVAAHVGSSPLIVTCLALTCVPPLLRSAPLVENFAIEIIGERENQAGFIQKIAASTVGDITANSCHRYWRTAHEVASDFDRVVGKHCDHPLIVDGMAAFSSSVDGKRQSDLYTKLGFDLATLPARTIVLLTGQQSLRAGAKAPIEALDRIFTIKVPQDSLHGIFEKIPLKSLDSALFGNALISTLTENNGHALIHFVEAISRYEGVDRETLGDAVARLQNDFLAHLKLDQMYSPDFRAEQVFSIIYAAGALAVEFGTLPDLGFLKSITAAYQMYRDTNTSRPRFADRLALLVESGKLLVNDRWGNEPGHEAAVKDAIGTFETTAKGSEVRIRKDKILEVFPDWNEIKHHPDVRQYLLTDKRNMQIYRKLTPSSPREKIYCFRIPTKPVG